MLFRFPLIRAIRRPFLQITTFLILISFVFAVTGAPNQHLGGNVRTGAPVLTYRLTDLGTINTNPQTGQIISHPAGINDAGEVTGNSYSGTHLHAARFTNGVVEDLGTIPGGSKSMGVGINDLGHVAGDSEYSVNGGSIRHATLFSNGTQTDLGFLPSWGNYSRGNGINNAGVIVGHSGASLSTSNTRAFIWDATNGMRDLGTIGGAYAKAFSINNSGVVTGTSQSGVGFGGNHAFIWDAVNGMRDIGTIAGTYSSGAFINDNGHIAGTSSISSDNREHAFLYNGTTMLDLGSLGSNHFFSDRSTAYGINIHDHVVGGTYRPYDGGALYAIPFIYRDGQMFDLTTLVDASGGDYRLYTATGINDAGQIAVDAIKISTNEIHAVLLTPVNKTGFDFDGDGKADVSVFRPSGGTWYLLNSLNGFSAAQFGLSSDMITPADYDGDGKSDIAVFRNGDWYIMQSNNNQLRVVQFGTSNDLPVSADYDGDGQADISVFRFSDGSWYRLNSSNNQFVSFQFGTSGDKPQIGDFDGDGKNDLAVYRPTARAWYIQRSSDNSFYGVNFGLQSDVPTPADYDGDSKTDISVYRPGNGAWYRLNSSNGQLSGESFGVMGDRPVAADYDGDGRADIAVFRPSNGTWYLSRSTSGFSAQEFGLSGDLPIPSSFGQ